MIRMKTVLPGEKLDWAPLHVASLMQASAAALVAKAKALPT